ncbi:hypothetical protein GCM10007063_20270 [Lentibacillus kapialis]|uniref:Uncharacterized protein n=1 Tax=Lentibacillus kapialis TaxID=340214 RepID=A0A917UYT9_9BACI|nr:hypothetical protein [Lentibacillus kapialis]GGJ97856.1 hypothetical protein GCM10007063_20270 [Lentibacillus kapialis]
MKKWITVFIGAVLIITAVSYYWLNSVADAELTSNETSQVKKDDFILHMRIESADEGFQVFRAIQYVGDESVEIKHQTPLVSVSFNHPNHDYTGKTVSNTLTTGNSYHPQGVKTFKTPGEGVYTLFCEARFIVNGEPMKISHQEELTFQ